MFAVLLLVALAIARPLGPKTVRIEEVENPIPGRYIAVFNGKAASAQIQELAEEFKASKTVTIGTFRAFFAELSPVLLAALASRTDLLEYITQDGVAHAMAIQTNPPAWGLDRIDQRSLPLNQQYAYPNTAGAGSTVYVLDTGIRITHQQFEGRARWGINYADSNNNDGNGHGTHCAGTVGGTTTGVAKESQLIAVKVLSDSGSGSWAGVISGIEWTVDHCATATKCSGSMSLGGGANAAVDDAVNAAVTAGVAMVVAAGNNNANACNYSPARAAQAITVGATDSADSRASYSNYGTCLNIFAPGSSIYSAWSTTDTAYNTISGTSMACPHVAGAVALLQSVHANLTPSAALGYLQSQGTTNAVNNPGSGSVNLLLFTAEQM